MHQKVLIKSHSIPKKKRKKGKKKVAFFNVKFYEILSTQSK